MKSRNRFVVLSGIVLAAVAGFSTSSLASDCFPSWLYNQANHQFDLSLLEMPQELEEIGEMSDIASIKNILDVILIPRQVDSVGSKFVRNYISTFLSNLGWFAEHYSFTQDTPDGLHTFTNLVARSHPERPRQLVLACHYDTLMELQDFVGGIDSAVPCSQLLDLAQSLTPLIFSHEEDKVNIPDLGLTLIFFDGEERLTNNSILSLYGSTQLAKLWDSEKYSAGPNFCQPETNVTQLDRIDLFVLLDLIGVAEPVFKVYAFDGTTSNHFYDQMMTIETVLSLLFPLNLQPMFQGNFSHFHVSDDQKPFWERGLTRILHLIPSPFPEVWHTLEDNGDTLDFAYISRLNFILRVFVAQYLHLF